MKKAFRFGFSVVILSSLAVSQLPQSGHCEMGFGAMLAVTCRMPCCPTGLPMPRCPMLKAAMPHDVISGSAPTLKIGLQPLHRTSAAVLPIPRFWAKIVADLTHAIVLLFASPIRAVRAPPLDNVLFAA